MKLDTASVATILVLTYAVIGGVLVIISAITRVDPSLTLSFHSYLREMAIAAGGLAIGRGLSSAGNQNRRKAP
jgi:hypothetical protein